MATPPRRNHRRSPTLEIREATLGDIPSLAQLGAKLARAHHAMDAERFFAPEEPLEDGYAWWLGKERANPSAIVLAAARRGRIVGYAYGRIEPRDWITLRDRCGVGVDLWVEPRARRAGIGAALVEALVEGLAARGAPRVILNVAARNPRAARLFAALGFRETMIEMTREVADRCAAHTTASTRSVPSSGAASAPRRTAPRHAAPQRAERRRRRQRAGRRPAQNLN